MKRWEVDGAWTLTFTHPTDGSVVTLPATVPGNVEIDLMRAGLIGDCMPPDDAGATKAFDVVDDWTYRLTFDFPDAQDGRQIEMVFEGIDTIAEIALNGEHILSTRSMFRAYRAQVGDRLRREGNEMTIVIRSAELYARTLPYDAFAVSRMNARYKSQTYLRKARHEWGWDNAPRLLTSGVWRGIYMEEIPPIRVEEVYLYTRRVEDHRVLVGADWAVATPDADLSGYEAELTMSFGGEVAHLEAFPLDFTRGNLLFALDRAKVRLWWPSGMGSQDLYDVEFRVLRRGEVVANWTGTWGVRSVELMRTEAIDDAGAGEFQFLVNRERLYVRGTNWKPLSALHSQAAANVLRAVDLADDLNCNMIRVWGGGVYEDHAFFDECDRRGILVWQDFMFACEFPPRDDWYLREVADETAVIIRKLRNHPSLAVWCGDNEDDMTFTWDHMIPRSIRPSDNRVTREVLRECVLRYDPHRDYVESSPFVADAFAQAVRSGKRPPFALPEDHLYPDSMRFAEALRESGCRFIGETGPILINAMTDNPRIVAREMPRARRLWDTPIPPERRNLASHQTDDYFMSWRQKGREMVMAAFGRDFSVDEWRDYALAINILCGGIFKEAIEYFRACKWRRSGVLWWSLIDMWPMMFNYSVVDCDFHRKMPYYWIRQSQQPFCVMAVRTEIGGCPALYAANDTRSRVRGDFRIDALGRDGATRAIASGCFDAPANESGLIMRLPEGNDSEMWIIEWSVDGERHYNHFATGGWPIDFEVWRKWIGRLNELYKANQD